MSKPLVSIVIPVFNASAYLYDALTSILHQSYRNIEVIAVDDGSTDDSAQIIMNLSERDNRVIPLLRRHEGIVAASNAGLDAARGDFIARMDADDVAHPRRIDVQVRFLNQNRDIDFCSTWARLMHPSRRYIYKCASGHEAIRCSLLFGCNIVHPTVLAWRRVFDKYHYKESLEGALDYELWVRLSREHRMAVIPKVLLDYRQHPGSIQIMKKSVQEQRVNEIQQAMLAELRITVSEEQFQLHRRIATWSFKRTTEELLAVEQWMLTILDANASTGVYDDSTLRADLARRFYGICTSVDRREVNGIGIYARSAIAAGHSMTIAQHTRQWAKFVLQPLLGTRSDKNVFSDNDEDMST